MKRNTAKQCLLLVLTVALLCHAPLSAAQHSNAPPIDSGTVVLGDQCSLVPSPSMLKHGPVHCGQQNSTLGAQDAYWHALVFNAAFVYSEAECGSSQGPACMQQGSLELPFTNLAEAIGEAQRIGADLLLLTDIDDDVVFPAGLAVHGRASPVVAKYMNQVYSSSSPTELSGTVTVRSAGGAGVGGAPTMLVGLELSGSIELDGYFGSGVWFASNLISVPIAGEQVSGEVVVTRNHFSLGTDALLALDTDPGWQSGSNITVSMTVDCNLIEGVTSVVDFDSANGNSTVLVDVHDNFFNGADAVAFDVLNADRLYQRVARNHFTGSSLDLNTEFIDEQLVLFGQNLVSSPTASFTITGDFVEQLTYGNLFYSTDFSSTATAEGELGMLVAHRDNRHADGGQVEVVAYFRPSDLSLSARPVSALHFERNQLLDVSTSDTDFALVYRELPTSEPSRGTQTLLSTQSNFVTSSDPTKRLGSLYLGSSTIPGVNAEHLCAVRSQGDWLANMNGVQLYRGQDEDILASTYSLEVRHAFGIDLNTLADMYIYYESYSYSSNFVFHVLDSVVQQDNASPNAINSIILPYVMAGGQSDMYIARNRFSRPDATKKRSPSNAVRGTSASPTSSPPSAIYGPSLVTSGGKKKRHGKRSISVPSTLPYIAGLTLADQSHHSFSFVDNHVSWPGDETAAYVVVDNMYLTPSATAIELEEPTGYVKVEAHIDRNYFQTVSSDASTPVAYLRAYYAYTWYAGGGSFELTIDNNEFVATAGNAAPAVNLYTYILTEDYSTNLNLRFSTSYNSVNHMTSSSTSTISLQSKLYLSNDPAEHDVYRLNYDCELRGNRVKPQPGTSVSNDKPIYAGTYVTFEGPVDRPLWSRERVVADDNVFSGQIAADELIDVYMFSEPESDWGARSGVAQIIQSRGNYAAPSVTADHFISTYQYIDSEASDFQFVRTAADISSNNFAGSAGDYVFDLYLKGLSPQHSTDLRVHDNQFVLGSSASGAVHAQVSTSGDYIGHASVSNNQLLASGAAAISYGVYLYGFNEVEFDGNLFRGMDNGVPSVSDNVFYAQSGSTSLPLQVSFTNNAVRRASVSNDVCYFSGSTTDASLENSFSFTGNSFTNVQSTRVLYADMSAGVTVCGVFAGNSFPYSDNDAEVSSDLQYDQADGLNFIGSSTLCP